MSNKKLISTILVFSLLISVFLVLSNRIPSVFASTAVSSGWENSGGSDVTDGGLWTGTDGSPSISSAVKYSGSYSLLVTNLTETADGVTKTISGDNVTAYSFRARVRIDVFGTQNFAWGNSLLGGQNTAASLWLPAVGVNSPDSGANYYWTTFANNVVINQSASAITTGVWYKVQLDALLNSSSGWASVTLNDVLLTNSSIDTSTYGTVGRIDVRTGLNMTAYVDNYAYGPTPLDADGDSTAPTYSSLSASSTVAGASIQFNSTWIDETGLATTGGYIFSTNNTGNWANDTWTAFSTNPQTTSVSKTLNSTVGLIIGWRSYANDTSNNWNNTGIQTLTTTDGTAPTFGSITGNTTVAGAGVQYSVTISDNSAVSGYIASWNNTGTWVNSTWASGSSGSLTGTHNSTVGNKISVIFYANDTSNNWGTSATSTFTLTDGTVPQFSSHSSTGTATDATGRFNVTVTDNNALSYYIFSTNNTGVWVNNTVVGFTSNPQTLSLIKTLNGTFGVVVQWKWYVNDTANNWATSATQSLTTTADTYTITFSGKTSANLGETIFINMTITRATGVAVTNWLVNITKTGNQVFTNYPNTSFTISEDSATTHTFNVTGLYDATSGASVTPVTTGYTVVWTSQNSPSSPGNAPNNNNAAIPPIEEPQISDSNQTTVEAPLQLPDIQVSQNDIIILTLIIIFGALIAATLTTTKVKRTRKLSKPENTKMPRWR